MVGGSSALPVCMASRTSPRIPHSAKPAGKQATAFLAGHEQMAMLLPAAARIAALQKDCAAVLPALFPACAVLHLQEGQLFLATPTAALAAKLKQQLPKLQSGLIQRQWQVNSIKIKVQPSNSYSDVTKMKQILLPREAMSAIAQLEQSLAESPRNRDLKAALARMLERHAGKNK